MREGISEESGPARPLSLLRAPRRSAHGSLRGLPVRSAPFLDRRPTSRAPLLLSGERSASPPVPELPPEELPPCWESHRHPWGVDFPRTLSGACGRARQRAGISVDGQIQRTGESSGPSVPPDPGDRFLEATRQLSTANPLVLTSLGRYPRDPGLAVGPA